MPANFTSADIPLLTATAGQAQAFHDGPFPELQKTDWSIVDRAVGRLSFTLPYPPSVNLMYRAVNGRQILSSVGRAYKARIAALGMKLRATPLAGDVSVSLWFYRPARRGDLDNSLKATLDALKGVAFGDDAQVQQIHASRYDDKANPRVEVAVSALPPAPS